MIDFLIMQFVATDLFRQKKIDGWEFTRMSVGKRNHKKWECAGETTTINPSTYPRNLPMTLLLWEKIWPKYVGGDIKKNGRDGMRI
jgi:hypothetical protein